MKLAADANVLLAAALGGRARLILGNTEEIEEILTAETTFAEVEEYAVVLARKRRLPVDLLLLAVASLPVTVVEREAYADSISEPDAGSDAVIPTTWISWRLPSTYAFPSGPTTGTLKILEFSDTPLNTCSGSWECWEGSRICAAERPAQAEAWTGHASE